MVIIGRKGNGQGDALTAYKNERILGGHDRQAVRAARAQMGQSQGPRRPFHRLGRAGSHGTLYVGNRKTTVKDRKKEIGKGLLNKMLADLEIAKNEFP